MKVKDGTVNIWGLQVEMQPVLRHADLIWEDHGQELVVTSARDGVHSSGSLHYYGYAVDFRSRYFSAEMRPQIANVLQHRLDLIDEKYQVIVHPTHIHVEYDCL